MEISKFFMMAYPNLWFTVIFWCMFWPDYLRVLVNSLYQMLAIGAVINGVSEFSHFGLMVTMTMGSKTIWLIVFAKYPKLYNVSTHKMHLCCTNLDLK